MAYPEKKICYLCKKEKHLHEFDLNRTKKDGHDNRCKSCKNIANKDLAKSRIDSDFSLPPKPTRPLAQQVQRLIHLTKAAPVGFSELCDKMDLSPSKLRDLIQECQERKLVVNVEHNMVGFKPEEENNQTKTIGIPPVIGKRQSVGVISDTHLGSKYCLREQLKDFINYAYDQGVREILHPGDVLDGCYRHGIWEVSHSGLEAQAEDLYQTLPKRKGLTYHMITGNHDFTFTEQAGIEVGSFLADYFSRKGRDDLFAYGNRGAFVNIRGALIHLWHPKSGVSYARSYAIQKHIEKYSSAEKPNILLAGHWHVYCHVFERGVHGFACPTFQGGGSAFAKSIGGAPAIGGMILSWDLTAHGTLRSFIHEYRSYFEVEKPQHIQEEQEALEVIRK